MAKKFKKQIKKRIGNKVLKKAQPKRALDSTVFTRGRIFWIQALILFVLAVVIYLPTRNFEYVLDDKIVFTENNFVKKGLDGLSDIFSKESFTGYFGDQKDLVAGSRYRPLSLATFAVEHQFWGLNSSYSHWINMLLYGLLSILVFYLLSLIFPKLHSGWISLVFLCSVIFVVHPIHTEVVANIKGRDEILALMFGVLSIITYLKYLNKNKIVWLITSLSCFFLGILSKENVLAFLILIPLIGYYLNLASLKRIVQTSTWFLLVIVMYFALRYNVIGYLLDSGKEINSLMNNPFLEMNVGEKFATISYTLLIYLKLLFYPFPLTHDYYPYHIPIMNWKMFLPWVSVICHVALLYLALRGLKRKQIYSYAILFYLGTLFIVSNIPFSVGTFMNERFLFLPSFAWSILLVYLLNEILVWSKNNYISYGLIAIFVIAFSSISYNRIPAWKNGFELNKAAIKVSKNSARINVFMGVSYFDQYRVAEGKKEQQKLLAIANKHFTKAIEIHPKYYDALKMQAGVAAEKFKMDGDIDKLLSAFLDLASINPGIGYIHQYMDYLIKRDRSPDKMMKFVTHLGYDILYKQKHNNNYAIHYLNYGLKIDPSIKLYGMLAEVFEKMVSTYSVKQKKSYNLNEIKQKATYYRQKSRTLQQ